MTATRCHTLRCDCLIGSCDQKFHSETELTTTAREAAKEHGWSFVTVQLARRPKKVDVCPKHTAEAQDLADKMKRPDSMRPIEDLFAEAVQRLVTMSPPS